MKHRLLPGRSLRQGSWLPVVLSVVAVVACAGMGAPADSQAARAESIWHENSTRGDPVLSRDFEPLPSLSGLVKELKPAVVNIYTTQVIKPKVRRRRQTPRFGIPDPFFEEFFGGKNPFDLFERRFGIPRGELKRNSLGSGFIVSADGYILSNHHVVANASEIKVKLADGKTFEAEVVGSDEKTDIALLKVETNRDLPHVYLGDSDVLEVGDWVVAIGNPFGLGHTVTTGIISGKARQIGHGPYDDFLQTDAAINPGNSGGPLFDTAGNVVGINTAIVPHGSGIGFAVPINMAKELLPQLRTRGKVVRGWLGVGIQDLTDELAAKFGVEKSSGVLVSQVFDESPADEAGIQAGDIIVAVNGEKMSTMRDVTTRIASLPPGSTARIEVLRDDQKKTIEVVLGERERGEALAAGSPDAGDETTLGLTVVPLTRSLARQLGVDEDVKGLAVREVAPDSPAAGIVRSDDIILEVNRKRVTSLDELRQALAGEDDDILMRLQRRNAQLFVVIKK